MALWKDPTAKEPGAKDPAPVPSDSFIREPDKAPVAPINRDAAPARKEQRLDAKESLIAADITIEGKIEGAGHVRIAGRFKGDVQVQGNVTIEAGAHVTGEVRADTVIVGGELVGNIDAISRVELLSTGLLTGDLKAGSLTVAAGSRMRGRAEFGWNEKSPNKPS
jgi:cytoskeletal protein CcmA (bactofilin family)